MADSEEVAPSEPDPAFTRSQSASPRLLEGGSEMKARAADAERPAVRPEPPMSSRRERRRRACATAAAKPT